MTFRDLVTISTGNLWRMKLRTALTAAGILVAIAAFVALLSFAAGNQENITRQFNDLGLFSTMAVFPNSAPGNSDTIQPARLDRAALERISGIPGVNLVYPYDAMSVNVRVGDSVISTKAQALPAAAARTKLFSNMLKGEPFSGDSSRQVVISEDLMKKAGIALPDSLTGKTIVVSVRVSVIDSGFAHILSDRGISMRDRLKKIRLDSLRDRTYRTRILNTEVNDAMNRFLRGFVNNQKTISESLVVCGVRKSGHIGRIRIEPVIIPIAAATRFSSSGFSANPADLFAAMSSGNLFQLSGESGDKTFSQVTIDLDPKVLYKTVRDSVEALGYKTFSFAAQFEEIQKFFFYFDLALGIIGIIALITASLGIVNTMIMSITERRREIGIFKSLGAHELEIRALFIVESGVIGFIGTALGLVSGWSTSQIVSAIAHFYMKKEGLPEMQLFAFPAWLIFSAFAVGIGVSMLAGLYPASRAASVDPVEALRNE